MLTGSSSVAPAFSKGDFDPKRVGYLIREEDRPEIELFLAKFPRLSLEYIPVAIIGEGRRSGGRWSVTAAGTFSTVYKAIDINYYHRDNSAWIAGSRQDSWDVARLFALVTALEQAVPTRARKRVVNSRLNQCIREYITKHYMPCAAEKIDFAVLKRGLAARPPVFVAIKRINATSGPKRIAEELAFLRDLKGTHHIIPIISASRWEDQVIVVSPYFHGTDFRELLATLKLRDVAAYMRLLLEALAYVHASRIMHRDIKPSNFLFAREADGGSRGLLVDFGLAQHEEQSHSKWVRSGSRKNDAQAGETSGGTRLIARMQDMPAGYIVNDPRAQMKASRAGTRGFRAPEVLFKVAHQTVSIDVWSVGVILLTLLTRRYPFFQSTDDCDALVELTYIFGTEEMGRAARSYDRTWTCSVPGVPKAKTSWQDLCRQLNPGMCEAIPAPAFDLLDRLLDLDCRTRITAAEALSHPFLTNQH